MTGRRPPASLEAEESLLGAMLISSEAVRVAVDVIVPADFYKPEHGRIYQAMLDLAHAGSALDVTTVAVELERAGHLADVGGRQRILQIMAGTPASANAVHYAAVIAETATLRRALVLCSEIVETVYDGKLAEVEGLLGEIDQKLDAPIALVEPPDDLDELFSDTNEIPTPEFIVPGCLARSERMVVTGLEGFGKSTLLRQIAVQVACGVHPFDLTGMDRRVCLHVDMENSRAQSVQEYSRIATEAVRHKYEHGWLKVKRRPQGMDLTRRHDVRWLEALLAHVQPDLLLIGPLYKMMNGTERRSVHSEESAKEVADALDLLRVRYDVAMLIEAHSPHQAPNTKKRDLRPIGASLWLRWPEFGYGLSGTPNDASLSSWRLDRVRGRRWPKKLTQGKAWPWVVPDAL